jgi:osmotically-inducible protein OsmY
MAKIRQWKMAMRVGGIMSRFHRTLLLLCVLAFPFTLGGCAGILVVGGLGAAAGGGYAAAQERGVNGTVDDIALKNEVDQALLRTNPAIQEAVNTTVYNGRVLLTGHVTTPEMKMAANRAASATPGVRALYDEIEVAPSDGLWDNAKDAWITTRVRSELILDPDIRSGNYTIETENGSVYLIGSARSQYELDRATRITRYLPGVKRVVSYLDIRSGAPVAAGSGGPPPFPASTGPAGPSAVPSAGPSAPIEVQRL